MPKFPLHLLVIGLVCLLQASHVSPALSDDSDDIGQDEARRLLESGRILPLDTILQQLSASIPGKVLAMELEFDDGSLVYDFKVLSPNGRVQEVEVDATSGRILKIEDDD
jgi:uncharacterized membrane protein YkoI